MRCIPILLLLVGCTYEPLEEMGHRAATCQPADSEACKQLREDYDKRYAAWERRKAEHKPLCPLGQTAVVVDGFFKGCTNSRDIFRSW